MVSVKIKEKVLGDKYDMYYGLSDEKPNFYVIFKAYSNLAKEYWVEEDVYYNGPDFCLLLSNNKDIAEAETWWKLLNYGKSIINNLSNGCVPVYNRKDFAEKLIKSVIANCYVERDFVDFIYNIICDKYGCGIEDLVEGISSECVDPDWIKDNLQNALKSELNCTDSDLENIFTLLYKKTYIDYLIYYFNGYPVIIEVCENEKKLIEDEIERVCDDLLSFAIKNNPEGSDFYNYWTCWMYWKFVRNYE